MENDPEDMHNLWDDPAYGEVKRDLCDRLLHELIDSELGDPTIILKSRGMGGALRDMRQMENQPETRTELHKQIGRMD